MTTLKPLDLKVARKIREKNLTKVRPDQVRGVSSAGSIRGQVDAVRKSLERLEALSTVEKIELGLPLSFSVDRSRAKPQGLRFGRKARIG